MSRIHATVCASLLALGLARGTARAGDKVAVLNVEGDQSGQVEDALTSIVEDEHEVVSSSTFDEVAEKAGVKDLDTKGIAKVAKRLAVAAVIEGVMTRDDDGYQLTVRVRAQSGKTTKKVAVEMTGKKLSAKDKRSLGQKVLAALDEIDPKSGRSKRDENLDGEGKDAKHRARTGKLAEADDDAAAPRDDGDGDDGDAKPAKPDKHKKKAARKPKAARRDDGAGDADADADPATAKTAADKDDKDADDNPLAMRDGKAQKKAKKAAKKAPRTIDEAADDAPDLRAAEAAAPTDAGDDDAPRPRKHKSKKDRAAERAAAAAADQTFTKPDKPDKDDDDKGADDAAAGERTVKKEVAARDDDDDVVAGSDDDTGVHAKAHRSKLLDDDSGARPIQAAIVDAGASVVGRKLTFSSRAFPQAPRGYSGPFAPGGYVEGAVYPLAFSNRASVLAGLGMDFSYDQVVSLTTRSSEASTVALPTTEKSYTVGGRYRVAFGHTAQSISVAAGVDYGTRQFLVNRGGLPAGASLDLPDVSYRMIEPELAVRVPLGERVTLVADGRALLFRSAGSITTQAEYGAAKITGGEGSAGVEVMLARRVFLDVAGTATLVGFKFVGNGMQSSDRDGDPTTKDVGGALDRYLGGTATVGFMY